MALKRNGIWSVWERANGDALTSWEWTVAVIVTFPCDKYNLQRNSTSATIWFVEAILSGQRTPLMYWEAWCFPLNPKLTAWDFLVYGTSVYFPVKFSKKILLTLKSILCMKILKLFYATHKIYLIANKLISGTCLFYLYIPTCLFYRLQSAQEPDLR